VDFTHYRDQSVAIAVDLVNSRGSVSGTEWLGTPAEVRAWLEGHGLQVPDSITADDIAAIHEVRARLHGVFRAGPQESARLLNELLSDTGVLPQITDHDGHWHIHYVSVDAPLARRLAACAAMGLSTVVCEFGHERLGICAADNCGDVFVDTSRNRSRRYCAHTCSSRMNVAAYRARHKTAGGRPTSTG
jgi:predicted RNA-binding Zn ribbon-like protein